MVAVGKTKSARERARYSKYDQLAYMDRAGVRREGRVTEESVKAALLAVGTQGRFVVYSARTGVGHSITWPLGIAYFRNLQKGWYAHG